VEDALHYFVISTDAGYYAQSGFVAEVEEAQAFCSQSDAEKAAQIVRGTVCPQFVLYDELEQSFIDRSLQYELLYTLEEQQEIRNICESIKIAN